MAKSWCGFVPQNQQIKEQWNLLEASQGEIIERLQLLFEQGLTEESSLADEEEAFLTQLPKIR